MLTNGQRVISTKCGHLFHEDCLKRWLDHQQGNSTCPDCRRAINRCEDLQPLFLDVSNDDPSTPENWKCRMLRLQTQIKTLEEEKKNLVIENSRLRQQKDDLAEENARLNDQMEMEQDNSDTTAAYYSY